LEMIMEKSGPGPN